MALSGLAFIGFVLGHMYGNLKAFSGQAAFNEYAEHLRELGEPMLPHSGLLWILRVGLIVALVVHVVTALMLTRRAHAARTQKYAVKKNVASSISSRTMRWGGVTILVFLAWHLLSRARSCRARSWAATASPSISRGWSISTCAGCSTSTASSPKRSRSSGST
ncbi:MAG: succinate dehydrogenase cytochrome b subunit, partial [Actinobacteria bacterium]|nr:succinate dehydrogenase cytochrome b subunit [Actinomycetota bacterium]